MNQRISPAFLTYASEVLGDTHSGLTGSQIVKNTAAYAVDYGVDIPHAEYPFEAPNKRTALFENIKPFSPEEKYRIIKDLCDTLLDRGQNTEDVREVKMKLVSQYSHLESDDIDTYIDETLTEKTRHWLENHEEALKLYQKALDKYKHGQFERSLLDDLRLSLEKLLHSLLGNEKSLENQISNIGGFIKERGGSPELRNMLVQLINYYTDYQNTYIKHDDAVIDEEVEFVVEITSSFMKYIVRVSSKSVDSTSDDEPLPF